MQEQTHDYDSVLQIECEKCRYTAGPGMIKCPDRAEDCCPYILGRAWGFSLDVGLWPFYQCTTLYQQEQCIVWQRFTILPINREFLVRKVTELQPLDLDLSSYPMPQHPASVTVLFPGEKGGMEEAVHLVRATLFDLLARRVIGLCYARIDERWQGKLSLNQRMYLLVTTPNSFRHVHGALENRIVNAIKNHRGIVKPFTVGSTFPRAISIYELVRGIYSENQSYPAGWLISLVIDDAVSRGLVNREASGFLRWNKKLVLNPLHTDQLFVDRQKVETWVWQNPEGLPETFIHGLYSEIKRAIESRLKAESWDYD